jgi:hypothetical protein
MATALNDASSGTSQAAVGYFVDQKKGEVNELKQVFETNINDSIFFKCHLNSC